MSGRDGTDALIGRLVAQARPVGRLRPPGRRAAGFVLLALAATAVLLALTGPRPDLAAVLETPDFALRLAATALTGAAAALAGMMLAVPGRPAAWALLPLPPLLLLWVGTIGRICLVDWVAAPPGAVDGGEVLRCSATLVLTGLPLALAMALQLRRAAPPRPLLAAAVGGLSASAFTACALTLLHPIDASLPLLAWNGLALVLLPALAAALRPRHA